MKCYGFYWRKWGRIRFIGSAYGKSPKDAFETMCLILEKDIKYSRKTIRWEYF
jgi:hypothetical protein